jgi:hypothetical protein
MTKASLGAGNVEITLDGETAVLKPTLLAAQTISRQAGGIIAAVEAAAKFDVDAVTGVIALGLGRKPTEVAEAVWSTGIADLAPKAIEFLTILANGGRRANGGEEKANPRTSE